MFPNRRRFEVELLHLTCYCYLLYGLFSSFIRVVLNVIDIDVIFTNSEAHFVLKKLFLVSHLIRLVLFWKRMRNEIVLNLIYIDVISTNLLIAIKKKKKFKALLSLNVVFYPQNITDTLFFSFFFFGRNWTWYIINGVNFLFFLERLLWMPWTLPSRLLAAFRHVGCSVTRFLA